jgi:hypothetical protein
VAKKTPVFIVLNQSDNFARGGHASKVLGCL